MSRALPAALLVWVASAARADAEPSIHVTVRGECADEERLAFLRDELDAMAMTSAFVAEGADGAPEAPAETTHARLFLDEACRATVVVGRRAYHDRRTLPAHQWAVHVTELVYALATGVELPPSPPPPDALPPETAAEVLPGDTPARRAGDEDGDPEPLRAPEEESPPGERDASPRDAGDPGLDADGDEASARGGIGDGAETASEVPVAASFPRYAGAVRAGVFAPFPEPGARPALTVEARANLRERWELGAGLDASLGTSLLDLGGAGADLAILHYRVALAGQLLEPGARVSMTVGAGIGGLRIRADGRTLSADETRRVIGRALTWHAGTVIGLRLARYVGLEFGVLLALATPRTFIEVEPGVEGEVARGLVVVTVGVRFSGGTR